MNEDRKKRGLANGKFFTAVAICALFFLFIYQVQMELGIQSDSILLLVCYRLVLTKTRLRWKSGNTLLDD